MTEKNLKQTPSSNAPSKGSCEEIGNSDGKRNASIFTDIKKEMAKDPWFKIAEFLQQNWAVIIEQADGVLVAFYGDTCGVFDEMRFQSYKDAIEGLTRNDFSKFMEDQEAQEFIGLPRGTFKERPHPNGRIYSSGRYWV